MNDQKLVPICLTRWQGLRYLADAGTTHLSAGTRKEDFSVNLKMLEKVM
jgi:hypothetical protein